MKLLDIITRFGELPTGLQVLWTGWILVFVVLIAVSINILSKNTRKYQESVSNSKVQEKNVDIDLIKSLAAEYERKIKSLPSAAAAYKEKLRLLIDKFDSDPSYEIQAPEQVATIYRLYAATFIFGPDPANISVFKSCVIYLEKALTYKNNFSDVAQLRNAISFFNEIASGKIAKVNLEIALNHNFRIAMINASDQEVQNQVQVNLTIIKSMKK